MQHHTRTWLQVKEAMQRRLDELEIQLTKAQKRLERLDIQLAANARRTALVMSQNSRLGQKSWLQLLPDELLNAIAIQAENDSETMVWSAVSGSTS